MTIDGNVDGVDRRPRGDMRGEGGMSDIPGFIGFIFSSRMDGNRSLRRKERRLRDRRIRSKHKTDLFIGSGKMDNRRGRGVRVVGRDDMHSGVFEEKQVECCLVHEEKV